MAGGGDGLVGTGGGAEDEGGGGAVEEAAAVVAFLKSFYCCGAGECVSTEYVVLFRQRQGPYFEPDDEQGETCEHAEPGVDMQPTP